MDNHMAAIAKGAFDVVRCSGALDRNLPQKRIERFQPVIDALVVLV